MTAIRAYLIRLVCCGFLVSLAASFPLGKHAKNAVRLCGGCLMLLVVLGPILTLDGADLSGRLSEWTPSDTEQAAEAREKNDELLRRMVEEEASGQIRRKAAEFGAELSVRVVTEKEENGYFVPREIVLQGTVGEETRTRIEEYLRTDWGVPPERQRWIIP